MRTFKQQQADYHNFPLTILPEHKGEKDELHMVERNFLAFYKQITKNGTQDVIYMSRRVAQSTGLYEYKTKKPNIAEAELVILDLVEREYLMMYKQGGVDYIKYNVIVKPAAPEPTPLPEGTSTLF